MKPENSGFPGRVAVAVLVAAAFGVALYFRIYFPYDRVFGGEEIRFTGSDVYYHMRLVDSLVHHFPHLIYFDPYTHFPYGMTVGWFPFFYLLLAGIIWVVGLGAPSPHLVDVIGVYFPAVLGALLTIPVFFLGRARFNRWVGVIAAGLVAIFGGDPMGRSILGFTDHDVAGVLFSAVFMLFLFMALKTARERGLSYRHLLERDWAVARRPLVYSLLAGLFLGTYLLTWTGGLLFVFIVFTYMVAQFSIDQWRQRSTEYLSLVLAVPFVIALVMLSPISPERLYPVSLVLALLAPPALNGVSYLYRRRGLKPVYYPLTLAGLGLVLAGLFWVVTPALVKAVLTLLTMLVPNTTSIITEAQSILFPSNRFSLLAIWGNFTTGFFLSLVALGMLIRSAVKAGHPENNLLVVWSLVILVATLGERRFAVYFAVNVALLTGYVSWRILELSGFRETVTRVVSAGASRGKTRAGRRQEAGGLTKSRPINLGLGVIAIALFVFAPNIGPAVATASQARFAPSDAWVHSLIWLKDNTPDPFGDPDYYYQLYPPLPPGTQYQYPPSAYGVMAWWDYGHWITRISHRLPNATPAIWGSAGPCFIAQDEASADKIMDDLGMRYVIADDVTAVDKFPSVISVAGRSRSEFFDTFQFPQGEVGTVFFPEYYRSLIVRLYNFNGEAVTPKQTVVIAYQDAQPYPRVTGIQVFTTYQEAADYISGHPDGRYRIVSDDPFVSPVPLAALGHYRLVHSSAETVATSNGAVPEIKIFEYVK
ncbi:MAG: oligosaccharyl transferase, archaeosortase A system-associated [Chloroflexota bacterium]